MPQDKLLARMKNNPRGDWKISHVETLAKRYGFRISRPKGGGSHVTLRHDSGARLSIPARRPIIVDLVITYTLNIGAVRNADRIWVSTPQNRTYRGLKVCIYFWNLL